MNATAETNDAQRLLDLIVAQKALSESPFADHAAWISPWTRQARTTSVVSQEAMREVAASLVEAYSSGIISESTLTAIISHLIAYKIENESKKLLEKRFGRLSVQLSKHLHSLETIYDARK